MKREECFMIPTGLELGEGNGGYFNKIIKTKGDLKVLINNIAIILKYLYDREILSKYDVKIPFKNKILPHNYLCIYD